MDNNEIDVVISWSSTDAQFVVPCALQSRYFSDKIIAARCTHRYNGESEEDQAAILAEKEAILSSEGIQLETFDFDAEKPAHYHHNLARWAGFQQTSAPWVLFLDADEIPDGKRFAKSAPFFAGLPIYNSLWFACYWYFRTPKNRATTKECCGLLVRREAVSKEVIFNPRERIAFSGVPGFTHNVHDIKGAPLFHHYSWVRSKEEMLNKVRSWGHKGDKPWEALVEQEFSRPQGESDFVHGYQYEQVKPFVEV